MKWLIVSSLFSPSIGGVETVARLLAEELSSQGEEVTVLTDTADGDDIARPYLVIRRPSIRVLIQECLRADRMIQLSITLRNMLPLLICWHKHVVFHQTWYRRVSGSVRMIDRIKLGLCKITNNAAPSAALARHIGPNCAIIPNPFDHRMFCQNEAISAGAKSRELLFVGRLVSDKGVDIIIEALSVLKSESLLPNLTVVGCGPEQERLEKLTRDRGLGSQIQFRGVLSGKDLLEAFDEHRILIVPSRWEEPFGIVALEGIARGCFVIGSSGGGLPDAIGSCGVIFRSGSAEALAGAVRDALQRCAAETGAVTERSEHLSRHTPHVVLAQLGGLIR